ncbi:MAG: oligosaccharide flippase family protein [Chitinivibrionales bacterium]|nr:oligosaccharide flippase family protein [Chitinivibrionales bacterium]
MNNGNNKQGSRLIKNTVHTLFNTFFMLALTWGVSIWVARQLGPSNYGIFTLVLWFSGTISWLVGMGLMHALTKFIAEYHGKGTIDDISPIVVSILKIELGITGAVTIILLFFRSAIADYFFSPNETFYFFLAFLGLIPGVMTAIFSATIEGLQKFEYFTYANILISPFSLASKVAVLWFGYGIEGLLAVMLVFSVINTVFYTLVLRKEGIWAGKGWKQPVNGTLRARIRKYNTSVLAIILCDKIVWDKSENFFLGRFCPAAQIGFYNLGFNIAHRFMSVLPATFWRVLFPAMSSYFGSGDRTKMKRLFYVTTRYLAFLSFPMGVGAIILAYHIIHYLYGHEFIGAQRPLQLILISLIISSLGKPGSAILYGYEKQSFIYKYGAVLAVVNILLDIFLIRSYGALGAAIAYSITTVLGTVGGLIYTCSIMKLRYPFASIFKILFSTIIMGVVMELIILQNPEVFGFVLSLLSGCMVYIVCSLVLGTFEQEDYVLLESVKNVLPGKTKKIMDWIIGFVSDFKNIRKSFYTFLS